METNPIQKFRQPTTNNRQLKLSGLEPLIITPESNFINVGERTNVAGSKKFLRLIKEEKFFEALDIARHQVEGDGSIRASGLPGSAAEIGRCHPGR